MGYQPTKIEIHCDDIEFVKAMDVAEQLTQQLSEKSDSKEQNPGREFWELNQKRAYGES